MPPPTDNHAAADGHAAGQPLGHGVQHAGNGLSRNGAEQRSGDGDTNALHEDGDDLPHLDGAEVAGLGSSVHEVNDGDSRGTAKHGQEQTSDRQRHGECDSGRDGGLGVSATTAEALDHDDGGGHGSQCRVRCHSGADVCPTKGHHLKGATEEDALLDVTGNQTNKGAGHQRLVELPLVKNAFHTSKEGDEDDEYDRNGIHT